MGWYCNAGNRSLQAPRTRAHITWIKSISSGMASRSASEQDTSRHAASVHRGHGLGQRGVDTVAMSGLPGQTDHKPERPTEGLHSSTRRPIV
jgi:hypothetical protein